MERRLNITWFYFVVTALITVFAVGCNQLNQDEKSVRTYSLQDLNGYVVTGEGPVEIVHWFNVNHVNPGLHHVFHQGSLYIMATYDDTEYLDLEIDQVVLEDSEIIVTAETGQSVLKEGTTDEIEGYYSTVYMIEDVEPASGGVLQSEPYTLVLKRE